MFAQVDYLWVLFGTLILSLTAFTLALYIIYHNKKEIAARNRELDIIKEKHLVESKLQRASRMAVMGALAGGMTYYLNSILFAIRGFMEMMKNNQESRENINQLFKLTIEEVTHGLKVTDQLLQLAHPQKLEFQQLSVTDLVNSMLHDKKYKYRDSFRIEANFAQETDIILGDKILLGQLLKNLITNAVDAMPDGGLITVDVSDTTGTAEIGPEAVNIGKRSILISISDCGCGMDEATRLRIFEPFFTTKTRTEKLGLGLSFAYGIVKIHSGDILVESKPGQGTTISLYLPVPTREQLDNCEIQKNLSEEDFAPDLLSLGDRLDIIQRGVGQA